MNKPVTTDMQRASQLSKIARRSNAFDDDEIASIT